MAGILIQSNVAAATAVLGYDVFQNERKRVSSRLRAMNGISLVGSANINDTAVDVYIEDYYVGRFMNSRAGVVAPIMPDDIQPVRTAAIPSGSQISAIVVDAPSTNPIICTIYGMER